MSRSRETIRDVMNPDRSESPSRHAPHDTVPISIAPLAQQMARAEEDGVSPYLVIFDGMNMGNHIPLGQASIVLGRDSSCDIVIDDSGISRRHAKLQLLSDHRLRITDLGSTNGTYIKGKRIESGVVAAGEKILFGRRTLAKFVLEDPMDRMYQQELWSSCTRDGLTGISNRAYLKKRLFAVHSFAKRHHLPYSLILFGIDNLDEINRRYSMLTGDQLLVSLVRAVSEVIRADDVFSRYAVNELAVLSVGLDEQGAGQLATRICQEMERLRVSADDPKSNGQVRVRISAGIATVIERPEIDIQTVCDLAAENLERARRRTETSTFFVSSPVS